MAQFEQGVRFRVWKPKRKTVEVVVEARPRIGLNREAGSYFSTLVSGVTAAHKPRGCISHAWSVAVVLRALLAQE